MEGTEMSSCAPLIFRLLTSLAPVCAFAGECPDVPAAQFDAKLFKSFPESPRLDQRLLAFDLPEAYEGATFDGARVVYHNDAGLIYEFPATFGFINKGLVFEIWMPADYRDIEVVARYRSTSCIRHLRAKFVGFERVE
jgi:hypothetical protein